MESWSIRIYPCSTCAGKYFVVHLYVAKLVEYGKSVPVRLVIGSKLVFEIERKRADVTVATELNLNFFSITL